MRTDDDVRAALDGAEPYRPQPNGPPAGQVVPPDDAAEPHRPRSKGRLGDRLVLDPTDPLDSARKYIAIEHAHPEGRTLHRHRGTFCTWTGTCYASLTEEAMRARLYVFLEPAKIAIETASGVGLIPYAPTRVKVLNVADALTAAAWLDDAVAAPTWLDPRPGDLPAGELLPCRNGLMHLPTGRLLPHTPRCFGSYSLPFDYNDRAPKPVEWLKFLRSLWPDDPETIDTLQEVLGYLVSGDRRQQKIVLVVGPKRSGKGSIGRVIRELLGHANVAGPTLSGLGSNFGMWPLIGRPVAIISDARMSGRADAQIIAERLLSISGEDTLTIDRKYLAPWTGVLPTRFVILTNELPRIADASGALASRFIILLTKVSFYGREDLGLLDRLLPELPGILNWAVEGWRRLEERGHFVMPASSREAAEELEALGSPVLAFIRTCCEIAGGAEVECDTLFAAWRAWCGRHGREHAGTTQTFGRDLRAAVPAIKTVQRRRLNDVVRLYEGIRLREATAY